MSVSHKAVLRFIQEDLKWDPEVVKNVMIIPHEVEVEVFDLGEDGEFQLNDERTEVLTKTFTCPINRVEGKADGPF